MGFDQPNGDAGPKKRLLPRAGTMSIVSGRFFGGTIRDESQQVVSKRQNKIRQIPPPPPPKNANLEWVPMVEDGAGTLIRELMTHEDLRRMDSRRKRLLTLARSTSAIDTLIRITQVPRTVLPRLAKKPLIYVFLLAYNAPMHMQHATYHVHTCVHHT